MTTTVLQEPTSIQKAFDKFIASDFPKRIFPCRRTKYYDSGSIDVLLYRAFTSGAHFKEARIAELEAQTDAEPVAISKISIPTDTMEQEFAHYERRGYEKGLAAARAHPPKQAKAITAEDVTDEMLSKSPINTDCTKQDIADIFNIVNKTFNGVKP